MMSVSKFPDFDAYELFRATHSHNSTLYSHIVGLSSHFYAHIGAGHMYYFNVSIFPANAMGRDIFLVLSSPSNRISAILPSPDTDTILPVPYF